MAASSGRTWRVQPFQCVGIRGEQTDIVELVPVNRRIAVDGGRWRALQRHLSWAATRGWSMSQSSRFSESREQNGCFFPNCLRDVLNEPLPKPFVGISGLWVFSFDTWIRPVTRFWVGFLEVVGVDLVHVDTDGIQIHENRSFPVTGLLLFQAPDSWRLLGFRLHVR